MDRPRIVPEGSGAAKNAGSPGVVRVGEVALAAVFVLAIVLLGVRRERSRWSFRTDAGDVQLNAVGDVRLSTSGVLFEIAGREAGVDAAGHLQSVRDAWGKVLEGVTLGAFIDDAPAQLIIEAPRLSPDGPMHVVANAELRTYDRSVGAQLGFKLVRSPPALFVSLRPNWAEPHALALSLATTVKGALPFVRGTGVLADSGEADGPYVIFEGTQRAIAFGAPTGDLRVRLAPPHVSAPGGVIAEMRGPSVVGEPAVMFLSLAPDTGAAVEAAARLRHERVRKVHGRVIGGESEGVDVWGVGPTGRALVHARPGSDGRFVAVGPAIDLGFYATTEHTRASPIVSRAPNDNSEIELTLLPGGEARVRVVDYDTGAPLTSRLIVHGLPPTADPNFGPDYRASGAGPLMDALRGNAVITLSSGRYRVLATHGPQYTIDEQPLEIGPGSMRTVTFALRRVVDAPGFVGCDFHVHARPSFDSPVLPEDRVLSLVSSGIGFAVASEHNTVGRYGPAVDAMHLERELAHVSGVEITTVRPSIGHFNIFPYEGPGVPPFRHTTTRQLFAKARDGNPTRVLQVNHPRLTKGIGYFELVGLDTKTGRAEREYRDDFDTLEVYNGFESANRARVEVVLLDWLRLLERGHKHVATGDSDSHRIQYQWAGYPRTYVRVPPEAFRATGSPVDTAALLASLKAGHAVVSSGPMIDADIGGVGPGDTATVHESRVRLHVRVRAAPWVDVNEVEVFVGATSAMRFSVPSRPTVTGPPSGSLQEAQRAAIRYEGELELTVSNPNGFVVVVARGARSMDDVLPYMPIQPLAFTNPIWVRREP